jgi:hypothetical protein
MGAIGVSRVNSNYEILNLTLTLIHYHNGTVCEVCGVGPRQPIEISQLMHKKPLFLGLEQSFWRQKWASKNGESEPTSYPAENSQLYSADVVNEESNRLLTNIMSENRDTRAELFSKL